MEVRRIQQLSPSLVNRIAAGEVIERPASVVKELVENAIDAGATHIAVEIEDGGRELIRVIDNGGGIPPADLPLAFASHATSKLTCDDDLFRIATMGFRGEALASIGAVSQARMLSRTADQQAAYEIYNRGGAISDPQAAAGNVGTTVEVRNLFFNTPARRKFLKGAPTEFGHIGEMLLRLALPFPQIGITLTHNGRKTMDLAPATEEQRLLAAWPEEFHEQRLPLDVRDSELRVRGLIGLPELARPTAKYEYLFLNGRYIRDKFIAHAAREAYRGLIEPGRHPAAILMVQLPPQDVDVNVHPTKIEVRFRDGGRIHGLVLSGIREKLLGSDLTPNAVPRLDGGLESPRPDMRAKLAEFFRTLSGDVASPAAPSDAPDLGLGRQAALPVSPVPFSPSPRLPPPPAPHAHVIPPRPLSSPSPGTPEEGWGEGSSSMTAARPTPTVFPTEDAPPRASSSHSAAIQLHNSYLVAESDDGLVIIDQHALHERIMYEDLRSRLSRGPLESQRLLIPQSVHASSRQMALLEQIQPLLQQLGIEVSPFGPQSVAVHAFPSFLDKLEPADFVRELLERGEQELLDLHQEELLHGLLDMMACKAAVKAGDPLTPAEIAALLARRDLVERSSNCPHGRPTTLRLSLRDLEKQFKRTGF